MAEHRTRQIDGDGRGELVEETHPCGGTADRLLGEQLLLGLAQKVVPVATEVPQVVGAEVQGRVGEELADPLVVQRGPLQLEEDELRGHRRGAFLHRHHLCSALGVRGVLGEPQHHVVAQPAEQLLQLRGAVHQGGEPCRVEPGDAASGPGELVDEDVGFVEQLLDRGTSEQRIELPPHVRGGQVRGGETVLEGIGAGGV